MGDRIEKKMKQCYSLSILSNWWSRKQEDKVKSVPHHSLSISLFLLNAFTVKVHILLLSVFSTILTNFMGRFVVKVQFRRF